MKIGKLIEVLQQYNPNSEITIVDVNTSDDRFDITGIQQTQNFVEDSDNTQNISLIFEG